MLSAARCAAFRRPPPAHRRERRPAPQEFSEGHAPGAVNVPIMLSGMAGMSPNPDFATQARARAAARPDARSARHARARTLTHTQ